MTDLEMQYLIAKVFRSLPLRDQAVVVFAAGTWITAVILVVVAR